MDEQAKAINSKLIRLHESISEVILHASPMISRSMGMTPADQTLLGEITAMAATCRIKLEDRLRAPVWHSQPVVPAPVVETVRPGVRAAVGRKAKPADEGKPVIKPCTEFISSHKQWSLDPKLTKAKITQILGIAPEPGCDKTTAEWNFYADDVKCAIWDYKGAKWSGYGPREVFDKLGLTVLGR